MYRRTGQEQTDLFSEEQIRRLITGSGINVESEVDSDFLIFCPYHNNYRTPAGEVSKTRGTFFCFSCHESRSLTEFIMHVTGKSYFEAQRFIESAKVEIDIVDRIEKVFSEDKKVAPFDELMIKRLHNQALESDRAMSYYSYRKITDDSVRKFQLGYSVNQDMVTTPVHSPDGSVYYGFVGRSIEGKTFLNTNGNWRSKTLFNLHRARRYSTVYLVESNFDAIRLEQCGAAAVAVLGNHISNFQVELLTRSFNSVMIIADNDDGGNKMIDKASDKLGKRATIVGIPQRFKDVGDMTADDIETLITKTQDPLLSIIL